MSSSDLTKEDAAIHDSHNMRRYVGIDLPWGTEFCAYCGWNSHEHKAALNAQCDSGVTIESQSHG